MKRYGRPEVIVTDCLRSYRAAMKVIGNEARQATGRWLNGLSGATRGRVMTAQRFIAFGAAPGARRAI